MIHKTEGYSSVVEHLPSDHLGLIFSPTTENGNGEMHKKYNTYLPIFRHKKLLNKNSGFIYGGPYQGLYEGLSCIDVSLLESLWSNHLLQVIYRWTCSRALVVSRASIQTSEVPGTIYLHCQRQEGLLSPEIQDQSGNIARPSMSFKDSITVFKTNVFGSGQTHTLFLLTQ